MKLEKAGSPCICKPGSQQASPHGLLGLGLQVTRMAKRVLRSETEVTLSSGRSLTPS